MLVSPLLSKACMPSKHQMSKQDDRANADGEQMARDFFKQVQKREEKSSPMQGNDNSDDAPSRPALDTSSEEEPVAIPRKFTGGEKSLFSPETSQQTLVDRMREQEFNLAGRFQNTLPIQAFIVAVSIIFVGYVGLTGGITHGSERLFDDEVEILGGGYSLDDFRSEIDNNSSPSIEIIRQADESVWL